MPTPFILTLTSLPEPQQAERLAEALVDQGLAACVNILPAVTSVYRWQGRRESAQEVLLLIKTRAAVYPTLEAAIRERHPYELPEIIAVPVEQGLTGYLDWVEQCTTQKP